MPTEQSQENPGYGRSVSRGKYFKHCAPFHTAALKGDWDEAEKLLREDSELVRTYITEGGETALHIAAAEGRVDFVEKLLTRMNESDLEIPNKMNKTALSFAAVAGHVDIAKAMVEKNKDLIRGEKRVTPLYLAALQGHKKMAEYLFNVKESRRHEEMAEYFCDEKEFGSWIEKDEIMVDVLTKCIHSGLYDLAVRIVEKSPKLAVAPDDCQETPLQVLASKPSAFCGTNRQGFWCNIVNTIFSYRKLKARNTSAPDDARNTSAPDDAPSTSAPDDAPNHSAPVDAPSTSAPDDAPSTSAPADAYTLLDLLWKSVICQEDAETAQDFGSIVDALFVAAESGNDNFLVELIRHYPDLIYKVNDKGHSIFHIAVSQRHMEVFNLTYELRGVKDLIISLIDKKENNILHLAARLAPQYQLNSIQGAALQMQREVLWYKEVEKIVPPSYRNMKNKDEDVDGDGETPHELFLKAHRDLMREGERQMKQIAKSCMLVTILIATIIFTAAFTVPGGYDNNTGAPILHHEKLFMSFTLSVAVAILTSLTSLLMFLSVLISRYSDDDFLMWLPSCLVVGMAALFVSIVAMMGAFYSCLLSYELGRDILIVLLVLFISVPIIFGKWKWHLLFTILFCTYSSQRLFRSKKRLFSSAVKPEPSAMSDRSV